MKAQHSQKHSTENNIRIKSRQYDPDFKKKVATFAERKGNQEAKRRFGVSESNIRRWKKIQREHVAEKVAVLRNSVGNKNSKRKTTLIEDVPSQIGMKKRLCSYLLVLTRFFYSDYLITSRFQILCLWSNV